MTSSRSTTPPTPASPSARTGCWPPSTRPASSTSADVHVATNLGRLGGEPDATVLLAIALTARAVRAGSICLDLATVTDLPVEGDLPWPEPGSWAGAVAASPLVGLGVLHWEHGLLYLDRYHEQETQVLDDLTARAGSAPPHDPAVVDAALGRVFGEGHAEQRAACRGAAGQWTTVITGGPGTGKTTAVAGLLVALHEQAQARGETLRIALAAPTGKAAARLEEAVHDSATRFAEADRERLAGLSAMTLHRLLRPAAGQQHPLPPPPRQPPPPRRRRGRRVVHGLADDDGPPARGGAPRRPAGAGGRPGPALLRRRRRGPHRPGPRLRGAARLAGRRAAHHAPLRTGDQGTRRGTAPRRRRRGARGAAPRGTRRSSG